MLTDTGLRKDHREVTALDGLSHGNQQRVQLAAAPVHDPDLPMLDGLLSGLDPVGVHATSEFLHERADAGTAVVFSSPELGQVPLTWVSSLLYTSGMGRSSAKGRQNAVRGARLASRLTQADLAERVGVSRQTIVAIENGGYAPSVYLALALSETLGSSVEALFGPQAEAENGQPRSA